MVTISELTSDASITGQELLIADDGSGGTTIKASLCETTTTAAASLTLFLNNYISNIGLSQVKFKGDGSIQSQAASNIYVSSVAVGGTFYLIGDSGTDGSVRLYVSEGLGIILGLRISGVWQETVLYAYTGE